MGLKGAIPHNFKGHYCNTALKNNFVFLPDHPNADSRGYVLESVLVASWALGKPLPQGAIVHHVDGNRLNNSPTNLVICQDRAYHNYLHARMRAFKACGHANWQKCWVCKKWDDPKNLITRTKKDHRRDAFHRVCLNSHKRNQYHGRGMAQ